MAEISDIRCFNDLFTHYQSRFVRFANSYVRDITLAEDIVAEAFMIYWENRGDLPSDSNIPAYILTIVKNKSLNYLRQKKVQDKIYLSMQDHASWEMNLRITSLEACNPTLVFSSEIERIINETLASLPEKTLKVFTLSRYNNKSHKEIAEYLNITTKGVEFHITKALTVLRAKLKDYITFIMSFFSI